MCKFQIFALAATLVLTSASSDTCSLLQMDRTLKYPARLEHTGDSAGDVSGVSTQPGDVERDVDAMKAPVLPVDKAHTSTSVDTPADMHGADEAHVGIGGAGDVSSTSTQPEDVEAPVLLVDKASTSAFVGAKADMYGAKGAYAGATALAMFQALLVETAHTDASEDAKADAHKRHEAEEAHSGHKLLLGMLVAVMMILCLVSMGQDAAMKFLDKNFLILGINLALFTGLAFPEIGRNLENADVTIGPFTLPQLVVFIIFLMSGLGLDKLTDVNRPKALFLGVSFVLFLTPLLAIPIKAYGAGIVKLPLLQGAALFCAVPCTLSSGVAMVKQANGNVPLALVLTTSTNMLGVFTMPYLCSWIFSATVAVPVMPMLHKLALQTLVPFVIGLGASSMIPDVKQFATSYKGPLGKAGNCCIFFVVWLMSSSASATIMNLPAQDLCMAIALAIFTHIVYRGSAYFIANAAGLEEHEWVTFVLMCSQKSLPVCVSVLSTLPQELQSQTGTFIIPCIMAHFSQLMIDGYLTQRWEIREKGNSQKLVDQ